MSYLYSVGIVGQIWVVWLRGLKREGQIESSLSLLDYWSEQILTYPMHHLPLQG